MRLELSTILSAVLVASLAACSSSTGDGTGGSGGTGTGGGGTGGDTTTGTGGDDTTVGTGGAGGGAQCEDDCDCVVENVDASGEVVECDADCTVAFLGASETVAMCTIECDPLGDGAECGADLICFEVSDGAGVCLFSCVGEDACPGSAEFVCDQEALYCDPDGISE